MTFIRAYQPDDLESLYRINQAGTPGVSSETRNTLAHWVALGKGFVAEGEEGDVLGFITLIAPGTMAYPSANLRWFEARGGSVIYVDRIAIAPEARGLGVGRMLYEAAFEDCTGTYARIGCEVNRVPPNPVSLAFHKKLGFQPVGDQSFVPGEKEVIYLERAL